VIRILFEFRSRHRAERSLKDKSLIHRTENIALRIGLLILLLADLVGFVIYRLRR